MCLYSSLYAVFCVRFYFPLLKTALSLCRRSCVSCSSIWSGRGSNKPCTRKQDHDRRGQYVPERLHTLQEQLKKQQIGIQETVGKLTVFMSRLYFRSKMSESPEPVLFCTVSAIFQETVFPILRKNIGFCFFAGYCSN